MQTGNSEQKAVVAGAIRDKDAGRLDEVLHAVKETGSIDYARQKAGHYQGLAVQALAQLPGNSFRDSMAAIADLAIRRNQ
jgi:octaprenyl-diphosphate synthase